MLLAPVTVTVAVHVPAVRPAAGLTVNVLLTLTPILLNVVVESVKLPAFAPDYLHCLRLLSAQFVFRTFV